MPAAGVPAGFQESVVFSGLSSPTTVEFASNGCVFVAEKSGLIKVLDSLSDTTPTVFADLPTNVHNFWDRGLVGLALDPGFPVDPCVYVLYAHDAPIGQTAPRWGTAGTTSESRQNPPWATDGCVISGHREQNASDRSEAATRVEEAHRMRTTRPTRDFASPATPNRTSRARPLHGDSFLLSTYLQASLVGWHRKAGARSHERARLLSPGVSCSAPRRRRASRSVLWSPLGVSHAARPPNSLSAA